MRFNRFIVFLLVLTMMFSYAVPAFGAESGELTDIDSSYAKKEIGSLVEAGIISGYADGSFQPQKAMTRAELAKILVLSMGLEEKPEKADAFLDVEANSWYRGYVGALVASGITQGTSPTSFSPEASVTREELIVFFVRALGLEESASKTPAADAFTDKDQIADWAKSHVALAAQVGFVQGTEGPDNTLLFNPKSVAERQALARLAYEFKMNASQYVGKAKELADEHKAAVVTSLEAVSNTSIEVAFAEELDSVSKSDFLFDNNLQVIEAAFKTGSKSIVVLTTSAQKQDVVYTLSYKGLSVDKTVKGAAGFFGGGGGGGGGGAGGPSAPAGPSVQQQLATGEAQDTITITASGSYGPASGTHTTVEHLIVDPGPNGEVTLSNIDPQKLEVLSGDVNSVKLQNTIIKQLRVNAVNNGGRDVRIEAKDGASIDETEVESQAMLESSSTTGSLGTIKLASGAAGKQITLKGKIDGEVTVDAPGVKINLAPPTSGNSLPTVIKSLKLNASAEIKAEPNTVTEGVYIAASNTTLKVDGAGELKKVELPSGVTGATIDVGSEANIKTIAADSGVTVTGDPAAVLKLASENPAVQIGGEVKIKAIQLANEAISSAITTEASYNAQLSKIDAAEKAIEVAKQYGASDADFISLSWMQQLKGDLIQLRDQINEYELKFQKGDTASSVTQMPIFPDNIGTGITVVWSSDRPDLITPWSPLERPASGAGDAIVTITVVFYKMAYSTTKSFDITVKQYDASVVAATSLRSDLVLVEFNHPVVNAKAADFKIDNGLRVVNVTQYPQLNKYALLSVAQQTEGVNYQVAYKQGPANISFVGSIKDTCTLQTCPLPTPGPITEIPLPGVSVPGIIGGFVYENTAFSGLIGVNAATVTLIGTNRTVQTDEKGFYKFDQVQPGVNYSVQATKLGYSTKKTNVFTIASGEPYLVGPVIIYSAPKPVTDLKALIVNSNNVVLAWTQNTVDAANGITYRVSKDGLEIAAIPFNSLYNAENLQSSKNYTFSVKACNDMGCSEPTELNVQTAFRVEINSISPYYSVTNYVYGELKESSNGSELYQIPNASRSADYLLISLKDNELFPGRGKLDTSNAGVLLIGSNSHTEIGEFTRDGMSFLKIGFNSTPHPIMGANNYIIHGLKYMLDGQVKTVQDIQFVITFE